MKAEHVLNRFMGLAKTLSIKGEHPQHRLGCVIVCRGSIIGFGFNKHKTHPQSPHPYKFMHAEFSAAHGSRYDLDGAQIYIYREHKNGTPALARPCRHCWNYLYGRGAIEVIYSTYGGYKKEKILSPE